jgi:hypothetical protein
MYIYIYIYCLSFYLSCFFPLPIFPCFVLCCFLSYYPGWIGNLKYAVIEYIFVFIVIYKIIDLLPKYVCRFCYFGYFFVLLLKIYGDGHIATYVADENEIPSTVDGNAESVHNATRRGSSFNSYRYAISHPHQT